MLHTVSIIVSGRVQGVFFRQSTREQARALEITGYVKNMPDETVFILATGTTGQLAALEGWCRLGPPRAVVNQVVVKELPLQLFDGFTIERH